MSTLVGGLAQEGIKLDTSLAQHRLYDEIDAIATQREIGSPSGIAAQEQAAGMDPTASPATAALQGEMDKAQRSYQQGRMTHDQMMLLSERALRKAIAKRPGLAQEFRALAAQRIGRDVVGASIDFLAQQDAEMMTAASRAATDEAKAVDDRMKRQMEEIQKAGGVVGDLTGPEDTQQRWLAMQESIQDRARLEVTASMATDQKTTYESSVVLRREQDTQAFIKESANRRLSMLDTANGLYNALRSGAEMTDEQLAQVLVDVKQSGQEFVAWADQARASGTVDSTVITNTQDVLQKQLAGIESLISGDLPLDVKKKRLETELLVVKEALMMEEPQLRVYSAAADALGPQAVANLISQPGSQISRRIPLAVGQVLLGQDDARVTTNVAGDVVERTVESNFGAESDPALVSNSMQLFGSMAERFATVPDAAAVQNDLTGPRGFIHKLDLFKHILRQKATPEEAGALAGKVAVAAYAAQRRLQLGLGQEMPSLKGKVNVSIQPDGTLFQPKPGQTLTPEETAIMNKYNQGWSGRKVLGTISHLLRGDTGSEATTKAIQLIYQGQARAGQLQAASAAPRSGGGSSKPARASQSFPGAPAVGTEKQGYRYKGGDPAMPSSWEKT